MNKVDWRFKNMFQTLEFHELACNKKICLAGPILAAKSGPLANVSPPSEKCKF